MPDKDRARMGMELPDRPPRTLNPNENIHVFWLSGMSCEGCTIAFAGAITPAMEQLQWGTLPGIPKVVLHHPHFAENSGARPHERVQAGGRRTARRAVHRRARGLGARRQGPLRRLLRRDG